ncbi:hypothetical protein C8Q80DRAFT_349837 [Daedaleopsis nitida]|nr:hypothetical protein C8Q80DRAFT_349837 [Daedaleopsis nitida]
MREYAIMIYLSTWWRLLTEPFNHASIVMSSWDIADDILADINVVIVDITAVRVKHYDGASVGCSREARKSLGVGVRWYSGPNTLPRCPLACALWARWLTTSALTPPIDGHQRCQRAASRSEAGALPNIHRHDDQSDIYDSNAHDGSGVVPHSGRHSLRGVDAIKLLQIVTYIRKGCITARLWGKSRSCDQLNALGPPLFCYPPLRPSTVDAMLVVVESRHTMTHGHRRERQRTSLLYLRG